MRIPLEPPLSEAWQTEREARRWRSPKRSGWVSRAGALWAARRTTAIAARCKRAALAGCEGASPSASTISGIQPVESDGLPW